MKKTLIALTLVLGLAACKPQKPEHVIPADDMVEVLLDLHMADGLLGNVKYRATIAQIDTTNLYDAILSRHGYTRKDLDTSLFYYSAHITEFDQIYNKVLEQLNEEETTLRQEHLKSDSLVIPADLTMDPSR